MEGSCAQALYDFSKDAEGDLGLNVGDVIKVTEQINDEWLFGFSKQNSGQFPASFVQIIFDKMPDAVGIAIADFQGEEEGDLCFSKGDVVGVLEEIDENWCNGCTQSSKGIFPRSFVEFIDFAASAQVDSSKKEVAVTYLDAQTQAYGTSNEAFTAQSKEELTFPKGVRIELLQEVDSFWTLGSYKGCKGKFPTMFVDVVQELPQDLKYAVEVKPDIVSTEDETLPRAKALFLYVGTSEQDLNFDKGDIILLKEKVNEEWFRGQIGNSVGIFPASYVQVIVDLPFDKPVTVQGPLSPTNKRKELLDVNGMANGHISKSQMTSQKKRPAPTVVKVKSIKEEKGPVAQNKAQPPVWKPTVAPKPPVIAARPSSRNPNSFPLNNDCITVIKPERNASRKEKTTKPKTTAAPKPVVRPPVRQNKGPGQSNHVPGSSPLEKERDISARVVNGSINLPPGSPTVMNKPATVPRKMEQGTPSPIRPPAQDLKAKAHGSPSVKRPAPPLPTSARDRPPATLARVMTESGDLLSGDATPARKLPKPLAPQPPVRPSALSLKLPPSVVSRSADSSPAVEMVQLDQPGILKDPVQGVHFSMLQNPPPQRRALTPPPERRARPKSAYFQPGDRGQSMRKSATLTRRNTTRPSSKSSSKFFVDTAGAGKDVSPEDEGDLTSVEVKISEVQSKISAEANLLSGVETLLEVVTDPSKRSELKSKQKQHLLLIQELNEELTELEDEKSYLLAKYGKAEDIMNHMVRVEQQIQMLKSEAEQLEKTEDIATFEDLAQTREDSKSCRYMISALEEELVALRERLVECQKQYTSPEESAAKQQEQRGRVVEELIRTERDYVRDVTLCVTQVIPELANCKATQIDCQTLFSNMGDVAAVSTKLLHALERALQNPVDQIGTTLGQCFIDLSAELKGCYAVYCKQYDDAQVLSEKYEQDPVAREEVMNAMKLIRGETLTWDLPSYLIKPVQRILKYPLLLQEFLKNTPENEQGRSVTALAINSMTDVATSINEFKRRKDLVQKYQKAEGFGDKISRLNWHSILKKSSRMNQRLTQITGINARTVDTAYDEEEKKIRGLEKLVKILIKNLSTYIEGTQEQISLHKQNIGNIYEFCEDLSPPDQVKLFIHASQNVAAVFEKHISYVQGHVMDPLNDLLQVFQSPSRLMEKREDKLLDYDSWQKKSYRTKDKEKVKQVQEDLAKARNNYQALNSQLLEELPKLSAKCSKYISLCLTNFIHAHRRHSVGVKNLLGSLPQTAIPADSAAILFMHGEAIQIASEQLAKLTFTPEKSGTPTDNRKSTNVESVLNATGTLGRTNFYVDFSMLENELSDDPTSPISPSPDVSRVLLDFDNSPIKPARDAAEQLPPSSIFALDQWKGVPRQDLYRAKYAFQAQDKAEITVTEGDQLRVLSRADRSGNSEWWLVQSQASKGYIPSSYLEPLDCEFRQVGSEQDIIHNSKPAFTTLLDTSVHHDAPAQLPAQLPAHLPDFNAQVTSTPVAPEKQAFSSLPRPAAYLNEGAPKPLPFDLNRSISTEDDLQVAEFYVAEYDFEKSNLGELNLSEGQLVRVVNKHDYHGNTEWWLVEVDGTKGYVPGNYLSFVHSVPLG